jgi:hypothetical protein
MKLFSWKELVLFSVAGDFMFSFAYGNPEI